jgi:hypothetical protein
VVDATTIDRSSAIAGAQAAAALTHSANAKDKKRFGMIHSSSD